MIYFLCSDHALLIRIKVEKQKSNQQEHQNKGEQNQEP
jgi:hypothetical protein